MAKGGVFNFCAYLISFQRFAAKIGCVMARLADDLRTFDDMLVCLLPGYASLSLQSSLDFALVEGNSTQSLDGFEFAGSIPLVLEWVKQIP